MTYTPTMKPRVSYAQPVRHIVRAMMGMLLVMLSDAQGSAAAAHCVKGDDGREVCLNIPARRIVTLAPHLTELVYAIGAGDRLVGAAEYSDWPSQAKAVPRIGRSDHINLEAVLAARPDLVLAWQSGNPEAQLKRVDALKLPVLRDEPAKLLDIARDMRRLGVLLGLPAQADDAALRYETALRALEQDHRSQHTLRVFYQVWDRPLYTVNGHHWISDVMSICGGRNVFSGLSELAPVISTEAVLAADPDVILISGGSQASATSPWLRWPWLRAVREHHVYDIDADALQRPGPRLVEGAQQACAVLDRARAAEQPPSPQGSAPTATRFAGWPADR